MASHQTTSGDGSHLLADNPCWKGDDQNQCDLPYLLTKVNKETSIVFESPQYLVLNKPPDLRMDGPYPATVHKLLTYWYPSPLVLQQAKEDSPSLLGAVAKIHKANDVADNELRSCHQLDYATSGILLFGRTREAAAHTTNLWEHRKANKSYLAVLHGHVDVASVPILKDDVTSATIDSILSAIEKRYRKDRHPKKKNNTFQGYQPANQLFLKFKFLSNDNKSKKKRKRALLSDDQWSRIWQPVKQLDEETTKKIRQLGWKQLSDEEKELFTQCADLHNDMLRELLFPKDSAPVSGGAGDEVNLPPLFRLLDDPTGIYIFLPLAQIDDRFAMTVPSSTKGLDALHAPSNTEAQLDFKPSLTRCQVVATGTLKGEPVTKVQLIPKTGRRHQLRVHTALMGHYILGDVTYSSLDDGDTNKDRSESYPRMCLHAYSLQLPILGEPEDWSVTAPDPFYLEQGGELQVSEL